MLIPLPHNRLLVGCALLIGLCACAPDEPDHITVLRQRQAASPCNKGLTAELVTALLPVEGAASASAAVDAYRRSCNDPATPTVEMDLEIAAFKGPEHEDAALIAALRGAPGDLTLWERRRRFAEARGDVAMEITSLRSLAALQPLDAKAAQALASRLEASGDLCGAARAWEALGSWAPASLEQSVHEVERLAPQCPTYMPKGSTVVADRRTANDWLSFPGEIDGVRVEQMGLDSSFTYTLIRRATAERLTAAAGGLVAVRLGKSKVLGELHPIAQLKIGDLVAQSLTAVVVDELPDDMDVILGVEVTRLIEVTPLGKTLRLRAFPFGKRAQF